MLVALAAFVVFGLRRFNREMKKGQDYPFIRLGAATVVVAMMICMSVAWPQMWGLVGSWTWIGVTTFVVGGMAFEWRRFLKNRIPEDIVKRPATKPGGTPESN